MNGTALLALVALVCAGGALTVQGPINARLATGLGDAGIAACMSFLVGFLVLAAISLARGTMPSPASLSNAPVPWWAWVGGFCGALCVTALTWSVPKLGAVSALAALVFGQLVAALVLDRNGMFGLEVQPVSWTRLAGCALVFGGLVMSRL